jgi:carotenoid cleavage dioxygenase-like enzyme
VDQAGCPICDLHSSGSQAESQRHENAAWFPVIDESQVRGSLRRAVCVGRRQRMCIMDDVANSRSASSQDQHNDAARLH